MRRGRGVGLKSETERRRSAVTAPPSMSELAYVLLAARLRMDGCAKRLLEGQVASVKGDEADWPMPWRSCKTGAADNGTFHGSYFGLFGAQICLRRRKGESRMIHNRRRVSCFNREREMRAGRNARGNVPVELLKASLRSIVLMRVLDGGARRVPAREVRDLQEAVVQTLRLRRAISLLARCCRQRRLL